MWVMLLGPRTPQGRGMKATVANIKQHVTAALPLSHLVSLLFVSIEFQASHGWNRLEYPSRQWLSQEQCDTILWGVPEV